MIRLPPTSIALSERDVEFHLDHIRIYRNLLAAGFSREHIREILTKEDRPPSRPHAASDDASFLETPKDRSQENSNSSTPIPSSSPALPSSPPPGALQYRHAAVRQSSLLRFAQTATSESSQTDADPPVAEDIAETPRLLNIPPRRKKTYVTPDDSVPASGSPTPTSEGPLVEYPSGPSHKADSPRSSPMLERTSTHSASTINLPMRSRSRPRTPSPRRGRDRMPTPTPGSSPPTLPPPFSSTRRNTSLLTTPTGNAITTSPTSHFPSTTSSQSLPLPPSPLPPITPRRPPTYPPSYPPSSGQPALSTRASRSSTAFTVYNDRLPPSTQPRTSADLSRGFYLHPSHAAYTAPPGRTRTPSSSSRYRQHGLGGGSGGGGDGSPSADLDLEGIRARRRRARREREREVRVGIGIGMGIEGNWRSWEPRIGSRGVGVDGAEDVGSWREQQQGAALMVGTGTGTGTGTGWRGELEVDAVGEENFGTGADGEGSRIWRGEE